ncbi:hypothetical protein [Listeria booriae]|uniref:Uncharacterized protein n=1 Tax=Listeria booriae TaxID=1552123 RepID=A0A7X0TJK3_9LIST|nr:hypothetical protein [Listeria booriae]MBC1330363.1 hypothetical protein [Listeria booriae]MBC2385673.1 hypothetical protein [Listeria booriae]
MSKLIGLLLLILGIVGFGFSFSITGMVGFITCLVSVAFVVFGILFMIRAKRKRNRSYSYR